MRVWLAVGALLLWSTVVGAQSVTAVLEPEKLVALKPSVPGRVSALLVEEGDQVLAFDTLARLDPGVQAARVALSETAAAAEGEIVRSKIVVAQAKARLERLQTAQKKGAAQSWEVRQAELTLALAEADVVIAEEKVRQSAAQLALERQALAQFTLAAPFAGVILDVFAEPGEIVGPDQPILEIGSLDALKATAFMPQDWALRLSVGQRLEAQVPSDPGAKITVEVVAVDPRLDPASRSVRVTLRVQEAEGAVRPGVAIALGAP